MTRNSIDTVIYTQLASAFVFKGLSELYHLSWAKSFRSFYLGLNSYKKATKYCDPEKLSKFEQKYGELLESGNTELEKMKPKFVDKKLGANSKTDMQELRVKSKLEVNSKIDIQKLGAKLKLEINSKTDIQELRVKSKLDIRIKPKFGFRELKTMLKRLTKYKDNYLLFLRNYTAPFTNNLAERDLRPCKTKQKISGCFRTWEGLNCFARIRSFISTAKKNSLNVLEMIKKLVKVGFVLEG